MKSDEFFKNYKWMTIVILKKLGVKKNDSEFEDFVVESLRRGYEKIQRLKFKSGKAKLSTLVYNAIEWGAMDYLRERIREEKIVKGTFDPAELEVFEEGNFENSFLSEIHRKESWKMVKKEKLRDQIKEILEEIPYPNAKESWIYRYQGFGRKEIAKMMGKSEESVKKYLQKGRDFLEEHLKKLLEDL